jgi:hypothetical protein
MSPHHCFTKANIPVARPSRSRQEPDVRDDKPERVLSAPARGPRSRCAVSGRVCHNGFSTSNASSTPRSDIGLRRTGGGPFLTLPFSSGSVSPSSVMCHCERCVALRQLGDMLSISARAVAKGEVIIRPAAIFRIVAGRELLTCLLSFLACTAKRYVVSRTKSNLAPLAVPSNRGKPGGRRRSPAVAHRQTHSPRIVRWNGAL